MKYIIIAFPGYEREIEADSLDDVLKWISTRQLSKMEYHIFTGRPFTFENKVYQHLD